MPAAKPAIRRVNGAEIEPYLADLARLRMEVFRDFPYLYDGSLEYEANYVSTYAASAHSVIVLALVDERVVGASTATPLVNEAPAFAAPLVAAGYDPAHIFYGGESVLLPEYRGSGVYRQFFLQREAHAREAGGFDTFAFCAVERPDDHPLRSRDYVPFDATWARYGYTRHPELVARLAWKDVDRPTETEKPLIFWLKPIVPGPH